MGDRSEATNTAPKPVASAVSQVSAFNFQRKDSSSQTRLEIYLVVLMVTPCVLMVGLSGLLVTGGNMLLGEDGHFLSSETSPTDGLPSLVSFPLSVNACRVDFVKGWEDKCLLHDYVLLVFPSDLPSIIFLPLFLAPWGQTLRLQDNGTRNDSFDNHTSWLGICFPQNTSRRTIFSVEYDNYRRMGSDLYFSLFHINVSGLDCIERHSNNSQLPSTPANGSSPSNDSPCQFLCNELLATFQNAAFDLHNSDAVTVDDSSSKSKLTTTSTFLFLLAVGVPLVVVTLHISLLLRYLQRFRNSLDRAGEFHRAAQLKMRQMSAEKTGSDDLLYQMLPKTIANELKAGRTPEPETFDMASLYFSDIVGFSEVALNNSPMLVVDLLNTLYSSFDDCVEQFDVYKVETIGDSYIVASGLPVSNGSRHASELALLSLAMMQAATEHSLPGSDNALPLRIGLNSGHIVAGVIGLKNPRYCLFGDTINTASRMESTGEPYRIHCSEAFKMAADQAGQFQFDIRGTIKVKGKGVMKTFWLLGKSPDSELNRLVHLTEAY